MSPNNKCMMEFCSSAPGKVILFGEHSVVYGKTAIAAAINLRTYFNVKVCDSDCSSDFEYVIIHFSDEGERRTLRLKRMYLVNHTINELDIIIYVKSLAVTCFKENNIEPTDVLLVGLQMLLAIFLYTEKPSAGSTVLDRKNKIEITVRSDLPPASGLGSSASFSVAAAVMCLKLNNILSPTSKWNPTEVELKKIEKVANIGEEIAHGRPSGLDAAICSRGGAISFSKKRRILCQQLVSPSPNERRQILVINSGISRSTAKVVEDVRKKYLQDPEHMEAIFNKISLLTKDAQEKLTKSDNFTPDFCRLIEQNQIFLRAIGVSHDVLEDIINIASSKFCLSAKLTGAGRGGCVFALADKSDVQSDLLKTAANYFTKAGYLANLSSLFASGVTLTTSKL